MVTDRQPQCQRIRVSPWTGLGLCPVLVRRARYFALLFFFATSMLLDAHRATAQESDRKNPTAAPPSAPAPPRPTQKRAPPAEPEEREPASVPPDQARGWETPPPSHEPEDVGLFMPRAILFIPRYVLKVVFWPLQHGLRFAERNHVIEHVEDLLYNDDRTRAILPTLSYQSSLGLTVGARVFQTDLGGFGETVSFQAKFGGRYAQFYELEFDGERVLGSRFWIQSLVRFEVSPRLLFHGIGDQPSAASGTNLGPRDAAVETRFRQTRMLSLSRLGYTLGRPGAQTKLGVTGILNRRKFGAGESLSGDERSIEEVYDTAQIPGFDEGSGTYELNGTLIIDTRDRQGSTSSGVYLEMFGGGVLPAGESRFGHFGGELANYVDLYRKTRVLVLRAASEAVSGDDEEIPFADLPRVGGPNRLRGYTLDRFRDRTTAVATAEYHYPIHEYIAGSVFVDSGRAAPSYRDLFSFGDWRWGAGGGVIVRSKTSILFTLDVAYGDGINVYFATDPLRAFAGRNEQL